MKAMNTTIHYSHTAYSNTTPIFCGLTPAKSRMPWLTGKAA
jgi:hypothetical protein